jgi:hypothetical protein
MPWDFSLGRCYKLGSFFFLVILQHSIKNSRSVPSISLSTRIRNLVPSPSHSVLLFINYYKQVLIKSNNRKWRYRI